jgi:predicted  nucleic acid-binding Zn-ribbon protein
MSSALTTFTNAKNRSARKSAETTEMKQAMVRADVESKMFSAYNSLCQNNSSVAIGSVDLERMDKAMADRMFK